ncbi:hypothetical protein D3C78_1874210 [compost metagenome]
MLRKRVPLFHDADAEAGCDRLHFEAGTQLPLVAQEAEIDDALLDETGGRNGRV